MCCMMRGEWFKLCSAWFMMGRAWFTLLGAWFMMPGVEVVVRRTSGAMYQTYNAIIVTPFGIRSTKNSQEKYVKISKKQKNNFEGKWGIIHDSLLVERSDSRSRRSL